MTSPFMPLNPASARALAGLCLGLACLSAQADQAAFQQSGRFASTADVHSFNLDVDSASDLRLWTTSWAAGQLDPVLAFFDLQTGALLTLSDDIDAPYPQVDATQGALDAGLWITDLAPGRYQVAVSLSPNLPAGSSWGEGYLLRTSQGQAVDSFWTAQVVLSPAAPVPEPGTAALLLAGVTVLTWLTARRR